MCLNVTTGKKVHFLLKNPSGVFMDDCYHETRHRNIPFAENRNYEMVLCQGKTEKKCLFFERLLSTLSLQLKWGHYYP